MKCTICGNSEAARLQLARVVRDGQPEGIIAVLWDQGCVERWETSPERARAEAFAQAFDAGDLEVAGFDSRRLAAVCDFVNREKLERERDRDAQVIAARLAWAAARDAAHAAAERAAEAAAQVAPTAPAPESWTPCSRCGWNFASHQNGQTPGACTDFTEKKP